MGAKMLKFVANDSNGLPQKPKHAVRACDRCRKRKKRCNHFGSSGDNSSAALMEHLNSHSTQSQNRRELSNVVRDSAVAEPRPTMGDTASSSHRLQSTSEPDLGLLQSASQHTTPSVITSATPPAAPRTYIGDLNPEAIFLAAMSPQTTSSTDNDVGIWPSRQVLTRFRASVAGREARPVYSSSIYTPDPLVSKLLLPYLQDQCLRFLPPQADYVGLQNIYFADVHPIFPVLDEGSFANFSDQLPEKTLLKQAICLAASTNERAKRFLRLNDETKLNQKEFAEQLSRAIRTMLELGLVGDKLVVLQVLTLLSLFMQLSNDRYLAADLNSRAVSLGQTMGIHLQPQASWKDCEYVTRLFCCLWALDRLNAAFHGRPVLMHERDFGHDLEAVFSKQQGCFQLLLRIVLLLDQVIALYRPPKEPNSLSLELSFPPFEDLVRDSNAMRVSSRLLATTELLYHAVAMLSCRSQSPQDFSQSTAARVRQSLSAVRVTSIVGDEFLGQLSLFPFVPYALCLSLKVSYRDLRLNRAPLFTMRARRQLLATCTLLRHLGSVFESAIVMVELTEQVLAEIDKVYSSMAGAQQQELSRMPSEENAREDGPLDSQLPISTGSDTMRGDPAIHAANSEVASGGVVGAESSTGTFNFQYEPNIFDQSVFEGIEDFDIFQHFDSEFNLEAIDATLGNNINPSFPMNLMDFAS